MVKEMITRDDAFELLKKYNKDPFHIQHALTVEAVMKWYANELGYSDEAEYWGIIISGRALFKSSRAAKRWWSRGRYYSCRVLAWVWNNRRMWCDN